MQKGPSQEKEPRKSESPGWGRGGRYAGGMNSCRGGSEVKGKAPAPKHEGFHLVYTAALRQLCDLLISGSVLSHLYMYPTFL